MYVQAHVLFFFVFFGRKDDDISVVGEFSFLNPLLTKV